MTPLKHRVADNPKKQKRKRVFVGIGLSINLQNKIDNWRKKNLSKNVLRKIALKNLHLTLIPPWYTDNLKREEEILQSIKSLVQPFPIEFYEVSSGPNPKNPRLLWLKARENNEISRLKKRLEIALANKSEKRNFIPHLTIARFKGKPADLISFKKEINWQEKIDNVTLFESFLSPKGADYKIIKRIKFSKKAK